jgi:hypothetical protein
VTPTEHHQRAIHWQIFRVVFALLYIGLVLDVVTTALGVRRIGSEYEQNPLGRYLIGHLGWTGLFVLLTLICVICYLALRRVYWRLSVIWGDVFNVVLVLIATVRWLVVIAAFKWLANK